MSEGFLIGRVSLRFKAQNPDADLRRDLSAVALDDSGTLWLGADEGTGIERLSPAEGGGFDDHEHFDLAGALGFKPSNRQDEIDIEGMDIVDGTLWLTGSHTSTRKKPKGEDDAEDLKRLTKVSRKPNRYVVGRVDLSGGRPSQTAASLPMNDDGNALTEALRKDPHLGPFLHLPGPKEKSIQLASKENGFDIEGLAVHGDRVFLGLRGPVLRGWVAILLEIEPKDGKKGALTLKKIGPKDRRYRKHFVNLGGMGVRDLCWSGDDLLILAGPTMDLTGLQTVWRLRDAADLNDDSITDGKNGRLTHLFDLPIVRGADKAEGIAIYDDLGEPGLMVLYDAPSEGRLLDDTTFIGDVYRLPKS